MTEWGDHCLDCHSVETWAVLWTWGATLIRRRPILSIYWPICVTNLIAQNKFSDTDLFN